MTEKNFIPVWYIGTARCELFSVERHIIKVGRSDDGESGASEREDSFRSSLKETMGLWGLVSDDELNRAITDYKFYPFTNNNAPDVEKNLKNIFRQASKVSKQKGGKEISPYGVNKDKISTEMFTLNKEIYNHIKIILSDLSDKDKNKYAYIDRNSKRLHKTLLEMESRPEAWQDLVCELSKESKSSGLTDESIERTIISRLNDLFFPNETSESERSDNSEQENDLLSLIANNNPRIILSTDEKWKMVLCLNGNDREFVFSPKSNGSGIRVQTSLCSLSLSRVKQMFENAKLSFSPPSLKDVFESFINSENLQKDYITKYQGR